METIIGFIVELGSVGGRGPRANDLRRFVPPSAPSRHSPPPIPMLIYDILNLAPVVVAKRLRSPSTQYAERLSIKRRAFARTSRPIGYFDCLTPCK